MVEVKHDEKRLEPLASEQLEIDKLDLKDESDGEGSEAGL